MAKTRGFLFSLDASGAVGGSIVCSSWKGRQYVRRFTVPSNPKTDAQVSVRAHFAGCVLLFKLLSVGDVAIWKAVADAVSLTPLNSMMALAQRNFRALKGIQGLPTRVSDTSPAAPTSPSATKSGNKVVIAWTKSVATDGYASYIYQGKTSGFTPGPSNLVGVVAHDTVSFAVTPGIGTWYWKVVSDDIDGNLSTPTASVTATIP